MVLQVLILKMFSGYTMSSNVTRDHHNLRRNLKLNSNYLSNDGGDEGITIDDAGLVTVSGDLDIASNMTISDNEIDVTGALTLDVSDDIILDIGTNAELLFQEAGSTFARLYENGTGAFQIYGGAGGNDYLNIVCTAGYGTFITTADADGKENDLTIEADGYMLMQTHNHQGTADDTGEDIVLKAGSDVIIDKNYSHTGDVTIQGLFIDIDKTGASTGANTMYGLHIDMDNLTPTDGTSIMYGINCTARLTHAADAGTSAITGARIVTTGNNAGSTHSSESIVLNLVGTAADKNNGIVLTCDNIGKEFDIRVHSSADTGDYFNILTGANGFTTLSTVDDDGADGHLNIEADGHVEFDNCAVGFDKLAGTFSTSQVIEDGNDSTDIDFRLSNKYELELTDNIAGNASSEFLNLIFPAVSGNFILVISQDGTGSRTIHHSAYVAYQSDGSTKATNAAFANGTDGDLRWAGGSPPTLTTTADKADIVSIYWDADNQTAFAVMSQNF